MSRWEHYELEKKHAEAGALVFGARAEVAAGELQFLYDGHYESEAPTFSIAIWPLGPAKGDWVPVLLGSGDLYFGLSDGQNRWRKLAPYELKELRREEAGWREVAADYDDGAIVRGLEAESRWYVVAGSASAVSVFFGAQVKPGKVPAALPEGLEVVRGQLPGAKAQPRATVGVWLADAAAQSATAFDPADARVTAAKKALAGLFGEKAKPGFVVLPTADVRAAESGGAQSSREVTGWRTRLEAAFGPLESEGGALFNGTLRGRIHELEEPPGDLLDTWFGTEDFAFNDRPATVDRWDGDGVSLAIMEVELHEGDRVEYAIGQIDEGYLLVLESFEPGALKELLGLQEARGARSEIVLGYG